LDGSDASVRGAAAVKIIDQTLLEKIATEDADSSVRSLALGRITDQPTIIRIVLSNSDPGVRHFGVLKLNDQPTLAKIAASDTDSMMRMAAIERLVDRDILAEIARNDANPMVRNLARSALAKAPPKSPPSEEHSSSRPDSAGRATIYVYRAERHNRDDHPLVYLNGEALSRLNALGAAHRMAPQGKVVVEAAPPFDSTPPFNRITAPDGVAYSILGCADLDLVGVFLAGDSKLREAGLETCKDSLKEIISRMEGTPRDNIPNDIVRLCKLQSPFRYTISRERDNVTRERDNVTYVTQNSWNICMFDLNRAWSILARSYRPKSMEFNAEVGKTYYVKWTLENGGSFELVDAAVGSKEVQGLNDDTDR